MESGAGSGAYIPDEAYEKAGVKVVKGADALLKDADAVLKVQAPEASEVDLLKKRRGPDQLPAARHPGATSSGRWPSAA